MTEQQTIGVSRGVSIAVVPWDGVAAQVDLSFACMYERALADTGLAGGLRHLNDEFDGALIALCRAGYSGRSTY